MTHLGDQVQIRRESKGWSRAELGRRAGLRSGCTHVRMIENGERRDPRASTVCKLAGALGLSPNDLLLPGGGQPAMQGRAGVWRLKDGR